LENVFYTKVSGIRRLTYVLLCFSFSFSFDFLKKKTKRKRKKEKEKKECKKKIFKEKKKKTKKKKEEKNEIKVCCGSFMFLHFVFFSIPLFGCFLTPHCPSFLLVLA